MHSTSANQSWGIQFQHKERALNLQNLMSLLSNRQNSASMTESGPVSPWMHSATSPIPTFFYFLYPLPYSLHASRFHNTWGSSSTDKAGLSFTQLITRKHPVHAPNSRLAWAYFINKHLMLRWQCTGRNTSKSQKLRL